MATRSETTPLPATLLTVDQVAAWLNVSRYTLRDWRQAGTGPRWWRVGGAVRYDPAEIAEYLDRQERAPAAHTAG